MSRLSMVFSRGRAGQGPRASEEEPVVLVDRGIDPHVVMVHDPHSGIAEQYRTFRTNLVALNVSGDPRALAITSAIKGEGKSITAANLAVALSELPDSRTLLIDADLRAPSVHRLFSRPATPGLSDVLTGRQGAEACLRDTQVPNLTILPAGTPVHHSSEIIGSPRLGELVAALKADFQYILFDTPPVLPFTDACLLGTKIDGAILVVRMEKTPKDQIEKAIRSLKSARTQVLGSFLAGCRTPDSGARDYVVEDD